MNSYDPNAPSVTEFFDPGCEVSLEEVAQTMEYEAGPVATLQGVPSPAAPSEAAGVSEAPLLAAGPCSGQLSPFPPIPPIIIRRLVSGRYRGTIGRWQLELRVDVDGNRPMKRVSGDFYQVSGATTTYFGSFRVDAISLSVTDTLATIQGVAATTWSTPYNKIKLTIPRVPIFFPPAAATLQWFNQSNTPGATYTCPFESVFFRSVMFEQDSEQGVTPFVSYDTGSLSSGGPARTLTVSAAYAESGIQFQITGGTDIVPSTEAGTNLKWSNSELHAAMVKHFTLWKDLPQWAVWLLAAYQHEDGPGLYGIMFDQEGKQRQGCAVFHAGIGGATAEKLRLQLYTYVHELGHCFNLMHSWQKSYAQPPAPNRPDALSWMNYPWNYHNSSSGPATFWAAFPFRFDDLELIHLRHAFRNNVIMGGNDFTVGSALTASLDLEAFAPPVEDNSGLKLELRKPQASFALGEPVVVELKLSATDIRGRRAFPALHPNYGYTRIGIVNPSGQVLVYEPLIEHCLHPGVVTLSPEAPLYDSAYIGYGKGGFYFDQPGSYRLRAEYYAPDGSRLVSNILTLRVRAPLSDADEAVADLYSGGDQGTLFYLLGSDSEFLKKGNDALDLVLDKYGDHALAVYAQLVKGINAGRKFKTVTLDRKMEVRKPQTAESLNRLNSVVEASAAEKGVDNITLNMVMRQMIRSQKAEGEKAEAKATKKRMVEVFSKKGLKPFLLNRIEKEATEEL